MVTQGRGMIPLWASHIPLCAHMMSREALVAVIGWLQACEITCPLLCVVPDSEILPLSGMRTFFGQKVHKLRAYRGILCTKMHAYRRILCTNSI